MGADKPSVACSVIVPVFNSEQTVGEVIEAVPGVLNCSVLDGWWCEGFDPAHGWAIGESQEYTDEGRQDEDDARSLYEVLSRDVVPAFYATDGSGLPRAWIERMKAAIGAIVPRFSASRMVREYTERYYPAAVSERE